MSIQSELNNSKDFVPFLVMGPSKSGTTWLQRLLDSHKGIRCHFQLPIFPITNKYPIDFPAENKQKYMFESAKVVLNERRSPYKGVFDSVQSEQEYVTRKDYLSSVHKEMLRTLHDLPRGGKKPEVHTLQLYLKTAKALCREFMLDQVGMKLYGTKAYTDLGLFFQAYPTAKVVAIFRDGRDVAVSKRFHHLRMGAYFLGDERYLPLHLLHRSAIGRRISKFISRRSNLINQRYFRRFSDETRLFTDDALFKIMGDWKNISEYLLSWKQEKGQQIHIVRYEELKNNPMNTLNSILEFLAIPTDVGDIEEMISQNDFDTLKKRR